jgi:hypothetical protein
VQVQQSALVRQLVRQKPSTQAIPLLQFAFEVQLGYGRTSGSHRPLSHMSCAGQLASIEQGA